MASLFQDPLLEVSRHPPLLNNKFYHFSVTKAAVILRWWTISPRAVDRNKWPGETKISHQDLLKDSRLQSEILMVFGCDVLECTKSLCQGHLNYLENLPDALLLRIMGFLELEDVGQLSRTSRRFWKLCHSETFWKSVVLQQCTTLPSEVEGLACDIGWRRIFFTNKIKLQVLVRRWRRRQDALVETSGDQNIMSEFSLVHKSPDNPDGKSQSSIGSSDIKKWSSNCPIRSLGSDHSLLGISRPSHLTFASRQQPGSTVMPESAQDLKSPPLCLSAEGHVPGLSPPVEPVLSSGEELGFSKIKLPILSSDTEDHVPGISPPSDLSSSSEEEFYEKLKKFMLARGMDLEEESDDSLSESENEGII